MNFFKLLFKYRIIEILGFSFLILGGLLYAFIQYSNESIDDLNTMSGIDPWFLKELKEIIDFEDLTTVYLGAMLTENFYLKAGVMHVDVITNESLFIYL